MKLSNSSSMSERVYTAAPLPFMGQKRRFIKDFRRILKRFDDVTAIVDLFGGSGILSHVAKHERPDIRVVYNDYDYYCDRLGHVETTNKILSVIRPLLIDVPKDKKVPDGLKKQILSIIRGYEDAGYVDYITLSSSLLFSGKYVTSYEGLSKQTMYNTMKQSNYKVDGYLDGLEVVHCDYRDLFEEFPDKGKTLFLIDPPYLSTEVGAYKCYWKMTDYLDVLKLLQGTRYIYFTSNKSNIVELCRWIDENAQLGGVLNGVEVHTQTNNINYNSGFTDMMLVKA